MPLIEAPKSAIPGRLKGLHLFHFDGAPHGWVSRKVSLVKKDHLTATYAEIHPNMVVPALVHDGRLYLESLDIIEYLDEAFGGTPLIPKDSSLKQAAMSRVAQAKELHKSIRIPETVYVDHLRKLVTAFDAVDTELQDGRKFLVSDEISLADAFWSMKILRLLECGYPVEQQHPLVFDGFQRVSARPSFQNEVMGNNRAENRFFRAKASVENFFGKGLKQAVESVAA